MSQPAKAQEPSMEEILASIRRIIADDDTAKPAAAKPAPSPAAAAPRPAAMPRHPISPPPAPQPSAMQQHDVDAMLAANDAPPDEAAPDADNVLDLTERMAATGEGETPSFQTIDGQGDVFFADVSAQPDPPPRMAEQSPRSQPAPQSSIPDRTIMSSATSAAVDSAFNALAKTVLVQNARTLEDLVREMLQPLLKSWLDDNLPGMVERIVKAEIERVSRGR